MVRRYLVAVAVVLTLVLTTSPLWAVPGLINYQGKLTDSGGNPLDGTFSMTFRLYDASAGGAEIWSEAQSVMVTDGIYSVELGAVNPLDVSDFSSDTLYLEVAVDGETLSPPQRLTSTAFAMKARVAEGVADGAVDTVQIMDSAVTEEKVAESAITTGKIATNAITSEKIADGTVMAADISGGSGSGLDADRLDGLEGSDFITGVNAGTGLVGGGTSGDVTVDVQVPFLLSDSVSGGLIMGMNNSGSTGSGVYGAAIGSSGIGIHGYASNTGNFINYGRYFTAAGSSGRGVYAEATGNHGRGVEAYATGTEGHGVYAYATGDAGVGVVGYTTAVDGRGVKGLATGDAGAGVSGGAESSTGRGVYGGATGDSGVGVEGYATGSEGRGVVGEAMNPADATNYGGYFTAAGICGRGVYGMATGANSWAGYFSGRLYASGNVGIGTESPGAKLTVAGTIESTSGGIKFPDGTVQTTAAAPTWHQILPAAERFELVMGGAAVPDRETGLVWDRSPDTTNIDWSSAIGHCYGREVANRKGWRLPTIEELASLVDNDNWSPPLPTGHPFINVQSETYWSSTTIASATTHAWHVSFYNGVVYQNHKNNTDGVWCVRGGHGHDGY